MWRSSFTSTSRLIQVTVLCTCTCVTHFFWGLAVAKWWRTRKTNPYRSYAFMVLTLVSITSASIFVYLVQQRSWGDCFVAPLFFFLGYRLCVCGLTGSIASGKSTVSSWLQAELGFTVVDADTVARQVLEFPHKAFSQVVAEFGTGILCQYTSVPCVDREALRQLVFNDRNKRVRLNQITHRYILLELLWQIIKYRWVWWRSAVVLDAALLFETHLHWLCAPIIVVSVDEHTQLNRLQERDRDKCDVTTLKEIIRAQMPLAEKCKRADIVVDNNGTREQLYDRLASTFGTHCGGPK